MSNRDNIIPIIPQKLAYVRDLRHLKQSELSVCISDYLNEGSPVLSVSTISSWETGKRPVPEKYYEPIAKVLDVSILYLCGLTDDLDGVIPVEYPTDTLATPNLISNNDIFKYDGMPVFVVFEDFSSDSRWGIYDGKRARIWFADSYLNMSVVYKNPKIRIYKMRPDYLGLVDFSSASIPFSEAIIKEQVYIKMKSPDPEVHKAYDGWYQTAPEGKPFFVSAIGVPLPFSGYGISYLCFANICSSI